MAGYLHARDQPARRRDSDVRFGVLSLRIVVLLAAAVSVLVERGFYEPPLTLRHSHILQVVLVVIYGLDVWVSAWFGRLALRDQRPIWLDALLLAAALIGAGSGVIPGGMFLWQLFESGVLLLLVMEFWRLYAALSRQLKYPGLLLPASFLLLIIIGTLLLKLPRAVPPGSELSWIDATYTITSAVCVTGLSVRDTATQFTPLGQTIIGIFIQLGGLGILLFGTMLALLAGGRLSLRVNLGLSEMLNDMPLRRINAMVRFIVLFTITAELIGAAAMFFLWEGDMTLSRRVGMSLFHAVSAFCNAGFALQTDSLTGYRYAALTHLIIAPLVVLGSIGFPVLYDFGKVLHHRFGDGMRHLRRGWQGRARPSVSVADRRLSLHTKIVLATTCVVYLYGTLGILAGQLMPYAHQALDRGVTANAQELPILDLPTFGGLLADASFHSIIARTAGFNAMPVDEVSPAGRFVMMTLMMIGGSPGGTGGGMKTTAAALLFLSVVATVRQRDQAEAFSRRIADTLVKKAATIAACLMGLIAISTLLLSLSEPHPFLILAFEATSAATTTGLSLRDAEMSVFGKSVIIVTMYLGRIGPLALLGALLRPSAAKPAYDYPHEDVMMG